MRKRIIEIHGIFLGLLFVISCSQAELSKRSTPQPITTLDQDSVYEPQQESTKLAVSDTTKKAKRIRIKGTGNIEKFLFYSPEGEKITSFNVAENTPIKHLNLPSVGETNAFHCEIYDVSKIKISNDLRKVLVAPQDLDRFKNYPIDNIISTTTTWFTDSVNYAVIGYNVEVFSSFSPLVPIGFRGTALIFNNQGEIIRTFENLDVEVWSPIVTENGRYFAFKYGQEFEDGIQLLPEGYRIYDVQTGELIFEERVDYGEKMALVNTEYNLILTAKSKNKEKDAISIIIDPNTRAYYYQTSAYLTNLHSKLNQNKETWNDLQYMGSNKNGYSYFNKRTKEKLEVKYDKHYHQKSFLDEKNVKTHFNYIASFPPVKN